MLTTAELLSQVTEQDAALSCVLDAILTASHEVFGHVKSNDDLASAGTKNTSGETQIGLDLVADKAFRESLCRTGEVSYVVSEEQADLIKLSGDRFSVALDPIDGSSSARVGIPCGSIFGIFRDVSAAEDFVGKNIVASGFFIYGIRHELFIACGSRVFRFREEDRQGHWRGGLFGTQLPQSNMLAINASNFAHWPAWLQAYYSSRFDPAACDRPWNMRWYASLVSEVKRLILEGGVFAYPCDARPGYADGYLRLVYEALPIAYLVAALGGGATDGERAILSRTVQSLHQRTPLFLGEKDKIDALMQCTKQPAP